MGIRRLALAALTTFIASGALLTANPAASNASGVYYWEHGCFSSTVERCWATNLEPNAGEFGSELRDDDINVLPTPFGNGVSYGGTLNTEDFVGFPITGGDYERASGDVRKESECAGLPPGTACNYSPSQFVTEHKSDAEGVWHFAMGGKGKCENATGAVELCNLHHSFYPYDCYGAVNPHCVSTAPTDDPFDWDFPESTMKFEVTGSLDVTAAVGPWHAFVCATVVNSVKPGELQICDEPFNTNEKAHEYNHIECVNEHFATLWEPAGESNGYGFWGSQADTTKKNEWLNARWTMTRAQFFTLEEKAHAQCGTPADYPNADDWKLDQSEVGVEMIGGYGATAKVKWLSKNETMETDY
jgi:hypothetical protein